MMLSLHRMFNLLNSLSYPSRHPRWPVETSDRQPPTRALPAGSPSFLHPEFAPFEPDLTQEIRQALGEQAARSAGDVP